MELIFNTLRLKADFGLICQSDQKQNPVAYRHTSSFHLNAAWSVVCCLWLQDPANSLIFCRKRNGTCDIKGRGMFKKAAQVDLLIANDDPVHSRFCIFIFDRHGLPILPNGAIGIDCDPEANNRAHDTFELRFHARNFEDDLFATGFCISDPGERDAGIAVFTKSRKQALISAKIWYNAQRLHGDRDVIEKYIPFQKKGDPE